MASPEPILLTLPSSAGRTAEDVYRQATALSGYIPLRSEAEARPTRLSHCTGAGPTGCRGKVQREFLVQFLLTLALPSSAVRGQRNGKDLPGTCVAKEG